jgi:hypothetical protein
MILRRPSAAACRPKSARRVRVGGERRVSLARHRDVGTQHLKTTPSASDTEGVGDGGVRVSKMSGCGGRLFVTEINCAICWGNLSHPLAGTRFY